MNRKDLLGAAILLLIAGAHTGATLRIPFSTLDDGVGPARLPARLDGRARRRGDCACSACGHPRARRDTQAGRREGSRSTLAAGARRARVRRAVHSGVGCYRLSARAVPAALSRCRSTRACVSPGGCWRSLPAVRQSSTCSSSSCSACVSPRVCCFRSQVRHVVAPHGPDRIFLDGVRRLHRRPRVGHSRRLDAGPVTVDRDGAAAAVHLHVATRSRHRDARVSTSARNMAARSPRF